MSEELEKKIKDLEKKNGELLDKVELLIGEKRKATTKASDLEKEKDEALRLAKEEKLREEGKLEELFKSQLEAKDKEIEDLQADFTLTKETLGSSKAEIRKLLVDDGLVKQFMKVGVDNPAYLNACVKLHSDRATVEQVEGKSVVLIDGKPVSEYITSWADGEGKAFITFKNNGGGAGGDGNGEGSSDVAKFFDKSSPDYNGSKQLEVQASDPKLYDELRKKFTQSNPLVAS